MSRRHRGRTALALLLVASLFVAATPAQLRAPILILVSFDGWRWDYLDRFNVPHLKALAARGVRSQALIPSFPTLTFPNHYTIVTGLLPDHHGIVSNSMIDRTIGPEKFTMSSNTAKDKRWWGGEPIWTTAIAQGRKSASMFWPGSEAVFPTHWKPFDDAMPNSDRVAQVISWLRLPEPERPSFFTIYFSDVDSAGHSAGPDSPDVAAAAERLDTALGLLVDGVEKLALTDRTTFVVVSDHGMAATSNDRRISLSDLLSGSTAEVLDTGGLLSVNPSGSTTIETLYQKLAGKHPALAVYKRENLPRWLQYGSNPRVPAIIGLVEIGWRVAPGGLAGAATALLRSGGAHGYDPRYREMHGLFVAAGPNIRRGLVAPEFQNIHVYDFMCAVLGLTPAPNDGDPSQTASFFVR
jgi:predicted AlkP superfamily pyrophosphatase or phosphodiesterase